MIALELATNVMNCRRNPRYSIIYNEDGFECGKLKRDFLTLDLKKPFDQMLRVYDSEALDIDWLTAMYKARLVRLKKMLAFA